MGRTVQAADLDCQGFKADMATDRVPVLGEILEPYHQYLNGAEITLREAAFPELRQRPKIDVEVNCRSNQLTGPTADSIVWPSWGWGGLSVVTRASAFVRADATSADGRTSTRISPTCRNISAAAFPASSRLSRTRRAHGARAFP